MNERQSDAFDAVDELTAARLKSLERHMCVHAFELFAKFTERHGIDTEQYDECTFTPELQAEWDAIRAKLDTHHASRRQAIIGNK